MIMALFCMKDFRRRLPLVRQHIIPPPAVLTTRPGAATIRLAMAMKKVITIQPDTPAPDGSKVEFKKFEKKPEAQAAPGGLTEEDVFRALSTVNDPELPVSIVDLGLIYDVRVSGGDVGIKMTLTTPGCSMGGMISGQAEEALKAIGARNVIVQVVWDPPWNPDMMSPEAKAKLGAE